MQHISIGRIVIFAALVALAVAFRQCGHVRAEDWPQWRGPRRDAVSSETGLMQSWPVGGPKVAWQAVGLGTGYSSVVVGRGRLCTMGRRGSDVVVTALDAATGQPLWTRKIGETSRQPCSTPTLELDHLYALDPDGDLACLLPITDEGLKPLKPLTALEHLELLYSEGFAGPKLTDGIVDFLVPLSNLTTLNLTGAKLTDAGLKRLRGLKQLKTLRLVRTLISEEGVREFRSAVPECEVIKS